MNLFNYLMAKKGHNTSVRDDLFAYLLGKRTPKGVKTATGTTISITDATKEKIVSLTLSKESTQDGTPTPENPVEVKTVTGYRNLFDKDNANIINAYIDTNGNILSASNGKSLYINCKPNTTYTVSRTAGTRFRIIDTNVLPEVGVIGNNFVGVDTSTSLSITTSNNANYLCVNYFNRNTDGNIEQKILDSIMIVEGTEELPYVPYGNNYVAITNTNGTDTNYYTIPLNDNEIVGKGINLDELIINKKGKCYLNKKFAKIDSYNGETITADYWSTTGGLDTGSTIYYVLATPQLIDLNYTVDLTLFEGVNNISNSDDMDMTLKYY